jgi:hypothetical protein
MPRIAPAIGVVLALAAVSVPATPASSALAAPGQRVVSAWSGDSLGESTGSVTGSRSTLRGIGLDSGAPGVSYIHVSWNWIKTATGYRIQVSKKKDFSAVVTTQKKKNSDRRPAGGREATTVGHLKDATYYWVRVRKVKGSHKSPWSAPLKVATKAHWPDPITRTAGRLGPQPGTTTIHWESDGGHTDFFRIITALTPFGSSGTPKQGRHSTTFKVSGGKRNLTLTPAQTSQAGAALSTGRHLFFRVTAVRSGEADTQARPYQHLNSTTITGHDSTGTGANLRFASYNVHTASKDVSGHLWKDRAPLVAKNLANAHPALVALEEMVPNMWDNRAGGIGLDAALGNAGLGRYKLTRETAYGNAPGDARILYDPHQVTMTSTCDPTTISCAITMPDPDGTPRIAAYARFKDLATGQEFWFVSAHLNPGNNATTDDLRGRQAHTIIDAMNTLNRQNLPIIIGADLNSSQTSKGTDAPHTAFLQAGYYNTTAAATQTNLQYNSVNAYKTPEHPSNYGFGSMIDAILTHGLTGATTFKQWRTGTPYPSDHNLITTNLRLP